MNEGKKNGVFKILVTLLVFAMMIIGCKEESTDTGFKSIVKDASGNTYTLTTNEIVMGRFKDLEGTDYVLVIKMKDGTEKTSRGIINEYVYMDGFKFLLQPSVENSNAFTVTLTMSDKWNIRSIDGDIAVEEEGGTVASVNSPGRTINNTNIINRILNYFKSSKLKVKDGSDNTYTLTTNEIVTGMYQDLEGTGYVLTIQMQDGTVETSRGIINQSGIVDGRLRFTLQPSVENSNVFTVTLTMNDKYKWNISSIDGEIAVEGGNTVMSPGSIQVTTAKTTTNTAKSTNTQKPKSFMEKVKTFFIVAIVIFIGLYFLLSLATKGGDTAVSYNSKDGTYTFTSASGTKTLTDKYGNSRIMSQGEVEERARKEEEERQADIAENSRRINAENNRRNQEANDKWSQSRKTPFG